MAVANNFVPSDSLCFIINKYSKVPQKMLKSLILDFYTANEIDRAKDLLLKDIDTLNLDSFPKINRHRRDSVGKATTDLDDLLMAIAVMDERQLIGQLSTFVSVSPDRMPSVRLCEGDFGILWTKLSNMDKMMNTFNDFCKVISEKMDINIEALKGIDTLRCEIDVLKQMTTIFTNRHAPITDLPFVGIQ